ncbi:hypothetical protein EMIHUDRAFT_432303 [Emiliania huxleyi CCMP1516]|uniref:Fibronectin type-III domain-containing protein n=2 Tax=Emiliania huxleyi TaxID=2903 RepID=A0A0D3J3S8_EMIH1|nr:hypothetical protein EMIHUDRAFT_432303 [Emiliania huxleyi CCMP1516]EOD18163.1 hypothetical protein EMIHUDRAFT_432303 [Emiliania huxleyi CCMP1516]|eukprot:XP_005770592.1 hypothetical protein EMIHUDRAFT_432303 [Emiliania huxleyi CCMP1516]
METALNSAATAHALGLVRHGRLTARGAPASLDTLNGDWERCPRSPYVEERPHYVKRGANAKGAAFEMHLFYSHGHWYVTPSATHGGVVLCGARSDSLSPTTVDAKQWHQPTAAGGAAPMPEFEFTCDGPNTEEEPFLMEARHRPAPKPKTTYPSRLLELGRDFFLRGTKRLGARHVVWFKCPATGETYHSAAKPGGSGGRAKPGKRYCHLCNKCFSANNFSHQHLANLHRPGKIDGLRLQQDADGTIRLAWAVPPDNGLRVTHYTLTCSADGGASWHECMESAVPNASIGASLLRDGMGYSFRVAGSLGGGNLNAFAQPSPPAAAAAAPAAQPQLSSSKRKRERRGGGFWSRPPPLPEAFAVAAPVDAPSGTYIAGLPISPAKPLSGDAVRQFVAGTFPVGSPVHAAAVAGVPPSPGFKLSAFESELGFSLADISQCGANEADAPGVPIAHSTLEHTPPAPAASTLVPSPAAAPVAAAAVPTAAPAAAFGAAAPRPRPAPLQPPPRSVLASQSEMSSPMRSPPTAIASPPGGVRAGLSWEPWVMSDHSLMDTGDLERLLASPASPAGRPVYRKAAFGDAPGDECNGLISLEAVPCGGPPSAPPSAPSSYDNLSASPAAVEPSKGANGGADGAACAAERGHERRSRNLSSLLRSVSLAAASAAASTFGAEPVAEAARGSSHVSLGGAKKIKPAPGSARWPWGRRSSSASA